MQPTPIIAANNETFYIRNATNQDAATVRAIIFDTLISYGLPADSADTDYDLYDIEQYYGSDRFWVLTDVNDLVLGSFALFHVDDKTVELRKMYFHPIIRGKGLANEVMSFVLEKAALFGYTIITLETASVLKEAINLYKKYGFTQSCGTTHSGRCDVIMQRSIQM